MIIKKNLACMLAISSVKLEVVVTGVGIVLLVLYINPFFSNQERIVMKELMKNKHKSYMHKKTKNKTETAQKVDPVKPR